MTHKQPFIGIYNRSLLVTYLGVATAVAGMIFALRGKVSYGFVCLMIAGICDIFDGTVARRCKRTEDEKAFGVQVDSLADIISFCVLPVVLFAALGYTAWYDVAAYIALVLAGITRLGLFNIATSRGHAQAYTGFPVTAAALIFPLVYIATVPMSPARAGVVSAGLVACLALLFIANIRFKKPTMFGYIVLVLLAIVLTPVVLLLGTR